MRLLKLLADSSGELYFQKVILIAIAFVIGAALISTLYSVFGSSFAPAITEILENLLSW